MASPPLRTFSHVLRRRQESNLKPRGYPKPSIPKTSDERSAGMADWITARRGNTERTLTAAAGPSPCDPYRQALTMRPSLKARPLVS